MALPSVFSPRPALLVCACLLLAPLARAGGSTPESPAAVPAPPATVVPAAPTPVAPSPAAPSLTLEERAGSGTSLGEPEEPAESLTWMLTRTLLVFGAVVAFIYLTLNVGLRKLMGLQGVGLGRPAVVSVVERVTLDQRRTLFVLKAADEYLLVGGGENGLQMLSKLDTEAVERIRALPPPTPAVVSMSPFLQKLLARRAASTPGVTQPSGAPPPGA